MADPKVCKPELSAKAVLALAQSFCPEGWDEERMKRWPGACALDRGEALQHARQCIAALEASGFDVVERDQPQSSKEPTQ